jgi:hypothetical protein
MQPKLNTKRTLVAAALLSSLSNAWAATEQYTISASAIADVAISQDASLNFGTGVRVEAGQTCTLLATTPAETVIQADLDGDGAATNTAGTNFDALDAGSDCVSSGTISSGVYTITGEANMPVSIQLSVLTETDYTFTPGSGCVVAYDNLGDTTAGTNADDADTCYTLGVGTTTGIKTGDATTTVDTDYNADVGAVNGELVFTLGGTITAVNELSPDTLYTGTFDIVVTYE